MKKIVWAFCLFSLLLFACKDDSGDPPKENTGTNEIIDTSAKEQVIRIQTDFGRMIMWLYKGTPGHRENFMKLADSNFFDQTEFHRIVPEFVIQGGDPNSKNDNRGDDGRGGPGYTIPHEIDASKFKHDYAAVGAARQSDLNNPERESNGSQFYIVVDPAGEHGLDGAYTVFGKIIDGMEVAEKIVLEPRNGRDLPDTRIPMDIDLVIYSQNQLKDSFDFIP